MGTFGERTRLLEEMVGDGDLVGSFSVHGGPRTVPLHEGYFVNHMGTNGFVRIRNYNQGGPRFVEGPLKEGFERYYQDIADGILDGSIRERMRDSMSDMNGQLKVRAPIEYGALRKSGSYTVVDDGDVYHHHPPEAEPYD